MPHMIVSAVRKVMLQREIATEANPNLHFDPFLLRQCLKEPHLPICPLPVEPQLHIQPQPPPQRKPADQPSRLACALASSDSDTEEGEASTGCDDGEDQSTCTRSGIARDATGTEESSDEHTPLLRSARMASMARATVPGLGGGRHRPAARRRTVIIRQRTFQNRCFS